MTNNIQLTQVSKNYIHKKKETAALQHIDFQSQAGEIIGLVGPNGAGKSTFVKILCGILSPSAGEIAVLEVAPDKNRQFLMKNIGVMFGNRSSLWFNLPAIESVYLMRDIYDIPKKEFAERLAHFSGKLAVGDILQKPVRQMSLGQRIRVELLVTVLHQPQILILDEPTLGLDIVSKNHFRELLLDLATTQQTTIILTTHDLQDVEKVCSRVVLMNHGKKLMDATRDEFKKLLTQQEMIQVKLEKEQGDLTQLPYFREKNTEWAKFVLPATEKTAFLKDLLDRAPHCQFQVLQPELEDILYDLYS